jgi:hypothetical protein
VGGKFFAEAGQKEVYYVLGRTLALLRPELVLTQAMAPERLEAVVQAAISLTGGPVRKDIPPPVLDAERKILEKALSEPAKAALARIVREYLKNSAPTDLRRFMEAAELTAVRTGAFVAADMGPVKKMVSGEAGAAFRIQPKDKLRDLMQFSVSEDLRSLRSAVGVQVEVTPQTGSTARRA